jgi:hypothetical protein
MTCCQLHYFPGSELHFTPWSRICRDLAHGRHGTYLSLLASDRKGLIAFLTFQPHERIVASTIYYYETDSDITDDGLHLRFIRDEDSDFPLYREERHEVSV